MSQSPKPPDFFIVGAPKCGTTALSEYLRAHPGIFMAYPKEPHFLASDMPQFHAVHSMAAYLHLFDGREADHIAAGEASVWYLYSDTALDAIKELNPNARIIVMLRHPISFLISHHAHLLFDFTEDRKTLEEAWSLQAQRARGEAIPKNCRSPRSLQYEDIAQFGRRLDTIFSKFSRDQVLCILHEDFTCSPRGTYLKVLEFLGVPDDGRTSFPRINEAKTHRSNFLGRLILSPPMALRIIWRFFKQIGGQRIIRLPERLLRGNANPAERTVPDANFQRVVIDCLAADIRRLEVLLDHNFERWLQPIGVKIESESQTES